MAETIADLIVKLGAESAEFRAEIEKANAKLDDIAKKADEAGEHIGLIAGVADAVAEHAIEMGRELLATPVEALKTIVEHTAEMAKSQDAAYVSSQRLGLSSATFSALAFAARETGGSSETLEKALFKVATAADEGGKKWDRWHIAVRDANGEIKDKQELLENVVEKYESLGSEAERDAFANDLFGKSARELTPLIKELAENGIGGAIDKAVKFHQVISDADAKMGHDFVVSAGLAKDALEGIERELTSAIEPIGTVILQHLAEKFALVADKASDSRTSLRNLAVDGAVVAIEGIKGLVIAFDGLERKLEGAAHVWEILKKGLAVTPFGLLQREVDQLADQFGFVGKSIGAALDDGKTSSGAKTILDELNEIESKLKEVHETEEEGADGLEVLANKRAKNSGPTKGEEELLEKRKKFADELEKEADRARKELEEWGKAQAKLEFESQLPGLRLYFSEYLKGLDNVNKDLKLQDDIQKQSADRTNHWIGVVASQGVAATRKLADNLLSGKDVLQDMDKFAEQLLVDLAADAEKALIIAALKTALGTATGGFGATFLGLFGGGGAEHGGVAGADAAIHFDTGGLAPSGVPFGTRGRDSVPAWLMPDEEVLRPDDPRHVNNGGQGPGSNMVFAPQISINSLVPNVTDIQSQVQRVLISAFKQAVDTGQFDAVLKRRVTQRWSVGA